MTGKLSSLEPCEQLARIVARIYACGMTTTSGGNLSVRCDDGELWITPADVDKADITADDMVCIKGGRDGHGRHKASTQLSFHEAIYHARPDFRALIHVHPEAMVAFAVAGQVPDLRAIPQARQVCGLLALAQWDTGMPSLTECVVSQFTSDDRVKVVIIPNHGVVIGGVDLTDVFQRFETLEFCCRALIGAAELGGSKNIPTSSLTSFESLQPTWQLPLEDDIDDDHTELKSKLCAMVARACRQRLMTSSYGTVSLRIDRQRFLMTPNGVARWELEPDDVLLFDGERLLSGGRPSRAAHLHRAIYQRFSEVNAVIMTQAPSVMAHAVARKPIDVRTNPKSWRFVRDIANIPFGLQLEDSKGIPHSLTPEFPVVLVENDCLIALGEDLLQAFERVEVAEFTARSNLLASRIGGAKPVDADVIETMRQAFLD